MFWLDRYSYCAAKDHKPTHRKSHFSSPEHILLWFLFDCFLLVGVHCRCAHGGGGWLCGACVAGLGVSDVVKRGYSHLLASALSLRIARPAAILSHERDIPVLGEGRPNCARQSLASTLSVRRVVVAWYCHPGRHANVVTPCLLTPCLNLPVATPADFR